MEAGNASTQVALTSMISSSALRSWAVAHHYQQTICRESDAHAPDGAEGGPHEA